MSSLPIIKTLHGWQQRLSGRQRPLPVPIRPPGPAFGVAEAELPDIVRVSPVAMRYYHWFGQIDWAAFPERDFERRYPQMPVSHASLAAAGLVKVDQGFRYMSQLRNYLIEHPGLTWLLGFQGDFSVPPAGRFDPAETLPTQRHFTQMLRCVPNHRFQFLLDETVRLLRHDLAEVAPDFGQQISLDTKHILAWVKENNLNTRVSNRYDKSQQPKGDPDCKLGYKATQNKPPRTAEATPKTNPTPASQTEIGQYYWGYASGIVATKVPDWGEFVLAECTQPFNRHDITYFEPLMAATTQRLGFKPTYGAFDAAFDAFYVYEYFHRPDKVDWQSGFAAVPFTARNKRHVTFNEDGHPYCEADRVMCLKYTFTSRATHVEHQRDHYVCPLVQLEGATCPIQHPRWEKGGCTQRLPSGPGSRLRHQIDRDSDLYRALYDQRTATERINAQAKSLGIERPSLRNQLSITNQNTLIYVVLNLRALRRVQDRKRSIVTPT